MSSPTLPRAAEAPSRRDARARVLEVVVAVLAISAVTALVVGEARSSATPPESVTYASENEAALTAFAEALDGVGSDAAPLSESCLALARASEDLAAAPEPVGRDLLAARDLATSTASSAALSCVTAANGESPSALLAAADQLNSAREAGRALTAALGPVA